LPNGAWSPIESPSSIGKFIPLNSRNGQELAFRRIAARGVLKKNITLPGGPEYAGELGVSREGCRIAEGRDRKALPNRRVRERAREGEMQAEYLLKLIYYVGTYYLIYLSIVVILYPVRDARCRLPQRLFMEIAEQKRNSWEKRQDQDPGSHLEPGAPTASLFRGYESCLAISSRARRQENRRAQARSPAKRKRTAAHQASPADVRETTAGS
jgi:hypothetical protein